MSVDTGAARRTLEEHRDRLRREIGQQGIDPDSEDFVAELERGFADGAHTAAERGQAITIVRELRGSLTDVERALRKLDLGTYGTCERCGRPIGDDRLEAIPWARLCIACKQAAQRPRP
jgi:RNA polymerase-binding transcription factor DksA